MQWETNAKDNKLAIKSWCTEVEESALQQVEELTEHPALTMHVALMPDCHHGKGMPIGGVVAARNALIPSAVGVDIGCGIVAVETDIPAESFAEMPLRRAIYNRLKEEIPMGEGVAHKAEKTWEGFEKYRHIAGYDTTFVTKKDMKNLGTLGGGNHFLELQKSDDGFVWLMIHSGSRNLGTRVENHYFEVAKKLNEKMNIKLPNSFLTFLPMDTKEGANYFRDMTFSLEYAYENRRLMMESCKQVLHEFAPLANFVREINIHHNYAAKETHFGEEVYIHRKGATSARKDELGIIPGSMGTSSYIVRGLGNPESYNSCSHGAGRKMSRTKACKTLTVEECEKAMEGIVYGRWGKYNGFDHRPDMKNKYDLSEAPQSYKDIESVIDSEKDLIEPIVKLDPIIVLKG